MYSPRSDFFLKINFAKFFKDSFLLSAADCITAGNFQNKFKNYTSFCYDEYFGSKFVTVVATGDQSKHINFSGYQVSNQCAAMVEADILCPTTAFPELAYIRETPLHEAHYITDVQYTVMFKKRKNKKKIF